MQLAEIVSTWVSTYSWLGSIQLSTSNKKYRFGVFFKVFTKRVGLYHCKDTQEFDPLQLVQLGLCLCFLPESGITHYSTNMYIYIILLLTRVL